MSSLFRLTRTCRHCGAHTADSLRDARVGASCCDAALRDQVTWRTDDLERVRDSARRMLQAAEVKAGTLSVDAAARLRDAAQARLRREYQPRADELKADLARLQALLDGGGAKWPRPYADG